MIAKIMKGSSFKNVVNYVFGDEKNAQIVALDGLSVSPRSMIAISFEAQGQHQRNLHDERLPLQRFEDRPPLQLLQNQLSPKAQFANSLRKKKKKKPGLRL